jgi:hypothetical protein
VGWRWKIGVEVSNKHQQSGMAADPATRRRPGNATRYWQPPPAPPSPPLPPECFSIFFQKSLSQLLFSSNPTGS